MQLKLGTFSWYHLHHAAWGTAWLPSHASPRAGSSPLCNQHYAGDLRQQLAWCLHGIRYSWWGMRLALTGGAQACLSSTLPSHVLRWPPPAEPSRRRSAWAVLAPEHNVHFVCLRSMRAIRPGFVAVAFISLFHLFSQGGPRRRESPAWSACTLWTFPITDQGFSWQDSSVAAITPEQSEVLAVHRSPFWYCTSEKRFPFEDVGYRLLGTMAHWL